ncbi:relaxase/mobilization nuclease domain-containing protein [Streptomyces cinereoruber]|uniref:relaxase/mobilization nuclease domain-containing protein n=1 Tax=Streptomyces cinereoruber TaxID=67260 RepID=UPI0036285559
MIAKITKGRKAGGALRYDFGPGRREEHENPRIVGGSVPGTPQQVARIIDRHTRQRADVSRPIWRCSLSLPDEDGVLTDEKWAQIAEEYVGRMWGADVPWVAVRHGDDHIHLTVSRVRWNGQLASDSHDYARSRPIVRALEREHGLTNAEERSDRIAPQVSGPERAAAQRRGAARPEREQLRDLVRAARDASAGGGRVAFEAALTEAGVDFRANVARGGRMSGYSFSLPGWVDAAGTPVWSTASKVSRDLSWGQLRSVLGSPDPRTAWATPARVVEAAVEAPAPVDVAAPAPALSVEQAAAADRIAQDSRARAARAVSTSAARSRSTTRRTSPPRTPGPAAQPYRPPEPPQPRQGRSR